MDADQKFHEFLQRHAANMGCRFMADTFEGRESDEPIDGMAVDDVSGWLVPTKELTQFKQYQRAGNKDRLDGYYGYFVWHLEQSDLVLDWIKWDDREAWDVWHAKHTHQ
ncbi:MAG: hypothetical protein RSD95_09710 [Clostridia bacterium]